MSVEQLIYRKFNNKIRKGRGKNGLEYKACCPFCRPPDKRFKLYMNPERFGGVYNCYSCGQRGFLRDLIGKHAEQDIGPVMARHDEPLPDNVQSPGLSVPLDTLALDHPVIEYLTKTRKRAFDPTEMSQVYGVRYCVEGRRYGSSSSGFCYDTTNTLIFPIWMFGRVVGWQSRLLYDPDKMDDSQCAALNFPKDEDGGWIRPPKYYTGPGVSKGRLLYNFDNARKFNYVVITEGTFDCIAVGLPGVATFGKGVTEHQTRLIRTYWDTAILLLDPDDTSRETNRLLNDLRRSIEVLPIDLKNYHDAGDTPRDEIWNQIADTMWRNRLDVEALVRRGADTTPMVVNRQMAMP